MEYFRLYQLTSNKDKYPLEHCIYWPYKSLYIDKEQSRYSYHCYILVAKHITYVVFFY